MNERHGRQVLVNRVLNGFSDQSLGPLGGYGLDADPNILRETNFSRAHFLDNEVDYFLRLFSSRLILNTCVNVFRVLSENDHIAVAGVLDWRGYTLEPSYRPQTSVEVQLLPQRNIERPEAPTYRSGQRPLDCHTVGFYRIQSFLREPIPIVQLCRLLSSVDFHP